MEKKTVANVMKKFFLNWYEFTQDNINILQIKEII